MEMWQTRRGHEGVKACRAGDCASVHTCARAAPAAAIVECLLKDAHTGSSAGCAVTHSTRSHTGAAALADTSARSPASAGRADDFCFCLHTAHASLCPPAFTPPPLPRTTRQPPSLLAGQHNTHLNLRRMVEFTGARSLLLAVLQAGCDSTLLNCWYDDGWHCSVQSFVKACPPSVMSVIVLELPLPEILA